MALKTNVPGGFKVFDETYTANEDLSSSQNCVVSPVAAASGKMKVGLPSGQGVLYAGVLLNAPAADAQAEVRLLGEVKVKANAAFNCGVEVCVAASTGKIAAAAADDYVVGISKEAAAEANQLVTIQMVGMYQKN